MRRLAITLLALCTGLFVGSGLIFTRISGPASSGIAGTRLDGLGAAQPYRELLTERVTTIPGGVGMLFVDPQGPVLILLLTCVWLAAFGYLLRVSGLLNRLLDGRKNRRRWSHVLDRIAIGESPALMTGLIAGAIWPWVPPDKAILRFVVAAFLFAGMMGAAGLRLRRLRQPRGRDLSASTSLGMMAGWATLVLCMSFGALLDAELGMSQTMSTLIALLICAVLTVWFQLQIGAPFAYSLTVNWGLLGIAIAMMSGNVTIATATAIAMTVVGVALVRVTT
ncbi:hypothetical protein PE067_17475 [Paracoccus sp. DMF-8]|uniref:hypothetical protein n=1 Tax=Paracoccus sp. DMF-8 TaxID=3019445 RepID=UPI0023E4386D|nr:hypothetical protein [Paracoccus sp. DMF-8]MDF3607773.1 hypothetical protein [Paracoccus sp. DMF-8]